ncbi:MAG: hypothetical protein GWP10_22000, partial [Nitrospiraceae bacterium]|nr:hypothetical protein [Nitrospiraceae bacterium]
SLALKDAFNEERALITYTVENMDRSAESEKLLELLGANWLLNEQNLTQDASVQFEMIIPKGFGRQFSDTDAQEKPLQVKAASDVKQDLLALFKTQITAAFMQLRMDAIKTKLAEHSPALAQELDVAHFDEKKIVQVNYNALEADEKPNSTQQSVPSWIVFGMFFVIIPMSTIFINEHKQIALQLFEKILSLGDDVSFTLRMDIKDAPLIENRNNNVIFYRGNTALCLVMTGPGVPSLYFPTKEESEIPGWKYKTYWIFREDIMENEMKVIKRLYEDM